MSNKSRLIGFVLTALFLWLVARNISLEELSQAFRGADYSLVGPAALATFCGYLFRSGRWQRIVRPVAPVSFGTAFSILMMGFAANNLLPARLGEVVRAYLLGRKTGTRKTYGMSTIILERICDGLTLIIILGAVSALMPLPLWGQEVQIFSSLLFLGAAVAIIALLVREDLAVRLVELLLRPLPSRISGSLMRATGAFISGLHSLKSKRSLLLVAALSVVVWGLETTSYLLMTRAFGVTMDPLTQMLAAAFLLVVVNLGIMLPSAPGYVGTFQFFAVTALGAFGVPQETALAIAIASHLMQYLLVTAIGLFFFSREQLAFWKFNSETSADSPGEESVELPVAAKR